MSAERSNAEGYELSKKYAKNDREQFAKELRDARTRKREIEAYVDQRTAEITEKKLSREQAEATLKEFEVERDTAANSLAGRLRDYIGFKTSGDVQRSEAVAAATESAEAAQAAYAAALKPSPHGWIRKDKDAEGNEDFSGQMQQVIEWDESIDRTRNSITDLYAELPSRTIEEVAAPNNAIFVHVLIEDVDQRHNENSNIVRDTSFEDDIDILLALEPSISSSTVTPGRLSKEGRGDGLWGREEGGVILGKGRIGEVRGSDSGTLARGLYERRSVGGLTGSRERLEQVVRRDDNQFAYNELVINEPQAVGYFMPCEQDAQGTFWFAPNTTQKLQRLKFEREHAVFPDRYNNLLDQFQKSIEQYREKMRVMKERGLPFYAMTPDRRFFEVMGVEDDGTLEVGEELSPEEVSKKEGVSLEKRAEIGSALLARKERLFKSERDQHEAQEVLRRLKAQGEKAS